MTGREDDKGRETGSERDTKRRSKDHSVYAFKSAVILIQTHPSIITFYNQDKFPAISTLPLPTQNTIYFDGSQLPTDPNFIL